MSDNQGKPLIDVKAVIDDLKKKKRHVDFLSQEEKRAILDSRTSPHTPPGDDYVRAYFKERVGRLRNTLDAQDREASASDTIFFQIDTLSDHANRGHNSATGYQERTKYKDKLAFQSLFAQYRSEIRYIPDCENHREFDRFLQNYEPDVLRDWVNEIYPQHLRKGRPPRK